MHPTLSIALAQGMDGCKAMHSNAGGDHTTGCLTFPCLPPLLLAMQKDGVAMLEEGTALLPCLWLQAMGDKIIYFPAALSSTATLL